MKYKILLISISILLEIIASVFFKMNSYFVVLFVFLTTIYISFTIKDTRKKLLFCFFIGLFYDITITNTLFLNAIVFFVISLISNYLQNNIYKNQVTFLFSFFIYIILYRVLTYLILIMIGYKSFAITLLLRSILSSIILNFIYIILFKKILKPYSEI